ncbi:MAG TPA: GAF domain-containing protein [Sporichthyaceae bacterium]|jgi:GAF domain-containing protein|nr:GAF domain-containing protein [Sporichthyaceae bacterium]
MLAVSVAKKKAPEGAALEEVVPDSVHGAAPGSAALYELGVALATTRSAKQVAARTVEAIGARLDCAHVWAAEFDATADRFVALDSLGAGKRVLDVLRAQTDPAGWAPLRQVEVGRLLWWVGATQVKDHLPSLVEVVPELATVGLLPLRAPGARAVCGMVGFGFDRARPPAEGEEAFLVAAGELAALALHRAGLPAGEMRARAVVGAAAARAERVGALAAALVAAVSVEQVVEVFAQHAQAAVDGQTFSLRSVHPDERVARVLRIEGPQPGYRQRFGEVPLDTPSALAEAVATRQPVFVSSAQDNGRRYGTAPTEQHTAAGIEGLARLPLIVDGEPVAVLSVGYRTVQPFPPEERLFLSTVADLAAQALGRAMATERAQADAARAERVGALAAALVGAGSVGDVAVVLGEHVREAVAGQTFSLRSVDRAAGVARVVRMEFEHPNYREKFVELALEGSSSLAEVVASGRAVFVTSAEDNRRRYGPAADAQHGAGGIEGLARLPLPVEGELVAVLSIGYVTAQAFPPQERLFLTTVADLAAQALARAMGAEKLRAEADRARRLGDLGAALVTAVGVAGVAAVLAEHVQSAMTADAFSLRWVDHQAGLARTLLSGGAARNQRHRYAEVPLDAPSALAEVVATRRPVFVTSTQQTRERYGAAAARRYEAAHVEAVARFPLVVDGELVAILSVGYRRPRTFEEAERLFLTTVADLAAQALGRAMRGERHRADAARAAGLADLAAALATTLSVDEVTAVLAEHVPRAVEAQLFSLREIRASESVARAARLAGTALGDLERSIDVALDVPSALAEVAATRTAVFVGSPAEHRALFGAAAAQSYETTRGQALARLPLLVEGELVAILSVGYHRPRTFDEAERLFLTTVADLAAQALGRAQRTERLGADERRHRLLSAAQAAMNRRLDPVTQLRALTRVVVPELADLSTVHVLAVPVPPGAMPPLPVVTNRVAAEVIESLELPPTHDGLEWEQGSPVVEAIRQGRLTAPIRTAQVPTWARPAGTEVVFRSTLDRVVLAPVLADGLVVAVATFGTCQDRPAWSELELQILGEIAEYAALAVEHGISYQHTRHTALVLQHSLLSDPPDVDGLRVCARYRPAGRDEVGGDWYDAFLTGPGHLALAIGDVVGHDIAAAASMGQLRAALRTLALDEALEPGAILQRLAETNRSLHMARFATAVFARLIRGGEDWELSWARAGHPPPLFIDPADGRARPLQQAGGIALSPGLVHPYPTACQVLPAGSMLLLYTDGLIERRGVDMAVSIAELGQRAAGLADRGVEEVCDQLLHHAPNSDDVALLVVRVE